MTKNALIALLTVTLISAAGAQVSFTRIMEGDLAQDTGPSVGCAWGDYDNDGSPDLFVADAGITPSRLYHNNGDGTFSQVAEGTIGNDLSDTDTGVWADYDNDGDLDLFLANYSPPRDCFYRNDGQGIFTQAIEGAWVTDAAPGVGAAWGDYDNDGLVDLYVANSGGQHNYLYRNQGDGSMTRITRGPPVTSGGNSHGCAWSDFDGDGDPDLWVIGGNGQDGQQFLNNGDGSFARIRTGPFPTSGGNDQGVSCADYDNDGDLDLLVTGFGSSENRLYRNEGPEGFEPVATSGLRSGQSSNGAWGDYDNDGYLDLFISNYNQDNYLFHNQGDGTFIQVTEGALAHDGGRSCGCAWADYDNDGDLDLFVANGIEFFGGAAPPQPGFLYRNDGGTNHWLVLRLVGVVSNRSAIGAKVQVLAPIRGKTTWQLREVSGGNGYCSQNDLRVHFGLGDATKVETVCIEWPSGITQILKDVAADQRLTVEEQPIPRVALSFSEGGGTVTLNVGRLAGTGEIRRHGGFPAFSPRVAVGPWTPRNNLASIDLGSASGGQGRPGINLRESWAALEAFTLCGWLNARDLRAGPGGNRVLAALASSAGPGWELVQRSDGALQLGINQSAESSPVRSSAGRITEDPAAAPANWVFFAVTYDGAPPSGNAQFFFGTSEEAAQPDAGPTDYDRGVVLESVPVTVGNIAPAAVAPDPSGEGVHVRGLVDEIEVYGRVLSLEEIQAVQRAPASRLLAGEPPLTIHLDGTAVVLQWESACSRQPQMCGALRPVGAQWQDVRGTIEVDGFCHTLRQPMGTTQRFFRLQ